MNRIGHAGWVFAAVLLGCGDSNPQPSGPASLTIENQSQFDLRELRIHTGPSYQEAINLLGDPLPINATIVLHMSGNFNVTVYRERFLGGPTLALTTAAPIALFDGIGYQLIVFDESFRINETKWIKPPAK